jgi:SAM-dependent methyltransferase
MPGLHSTLHTKLVFGRRVRTLAESLGQMIPAGAQGLDVGCGDGQISAQIARSRENVSITGVDILLRPELHIPVIQFDGSTIPFADSSFDVVMFVDVLHHTNNPAVLLAEATRVTRKYVLLKDHFREGLLSDATLRLMDWFGNVHHGVTLPYNYLSELEWNRLFDQAGLRLSEIKRRLGLYPFPLNLLFERSLHFIALLESKSTPHPTDNLA